MSHGCEAGESNESPIDYSPVGSLFFSCDSRFGSLLTDERARHTNHVRILLKLKTIAVQRVFVPAGQRMVALIRIINRRASITILRDSFNNCRER